MKPLHEFDPTQHSGLIGGDDDFIVWNKPGPAPKATADALLSAAEKATDELIAMAVSYIDGKQRGPKTITQAHLQRARDRVIAQLRLQLGLPSLDPQS